MLGKENYFPSYERSEKDGKTFKIMRRVLRPIGTKPTSLQKRLYCWTIRCGITVLTTLGTMIFCLDDNFNVLSPKGRSCGCGSAVFYQRLNSNVGTCYEFKEVVELFSGDIHSDTTRGWDHRASAMKKTVVPCNI